MHRSTRGDMSETTAEPEWTMQEDDLLLSLLYKSGSGIRFEMRRPWKEVAIDMNAEALHLGLKTRFFHHENVRSRWWSKFGKYYAVGTPDEPELYQASGTAIDLTPLQDILACVGVESLNGQPLYPPTRRGFEPLRPVFSLQDTNLQGAGVPPALTTMSRPAVARVQVTEQLDHNIAQRENGTTNGSKVGSATVETSNNTNGGRRVIAFADGKGKRVGRDTTKSWLF
jgi:hypothetical protein